MKFVLVLGLTASLASAAAAQPPPYPPAYPGPYPGAPVTAGPMQPPEFPPRPSSVPWTLERREHWLEQRVGRGLAEGVIDRPEAERVHRELDDIRFQEQRFRIVNGGVLTERDRQKLEQRLDQLIGEIHWLRDTGEPRPW